MDRFFDDRDYYKLAREQSKQDALARFSALPDHQLVAANDLAQLLGLSVSTVRRKAQQDRYFPKPVEIGRGHSRFLAGDVRLYLASLQRLAACTPPIAKTAKASNAGDV